jgi:hypothetical protein
MKFQMLIYLRECVPLAARRPVQASLHSTTETWEDAPLAWTYRDMPVGASTSARGYSLKYGAKIMAGALKKVRECIRTQVCATPRGQAFNLGPDCGIKRARRATG